MNAIQQTSEPIRYGIVGVGGFGAQRRKRLRKAGCFYMVGGVDIREEVFPSAEADEGHPLKRYATIEDLVADPEIEAVFIATPASLHVPQAMIAARAGKAIFCEKPLGPRHDECLALVEYCEQHGIPHGHGFNFRINPIW